MSTPNTAEQILDLKRQAIALKDAGDTNGAMALLAQARDLEFENARVEDLWQPVKLKQYAVVMKKKGDLDAARQALIKAKQIEKEGLTPPPAAVEPNNAPPDATTQQAPAPPSATQEIANDPSPKEPAATAEINHEPTPAPPKETPSPPVRVEESVPEEDNSSHDDLKELMQLDQPADTPMDDVAFTMEEMADAEMMTEFKLGGMPTPSDEEYQAKILQGKKAALAAKKAGDTTKALHFLNKSKQLEQVRVALSQLSGSGEAGSELLDDGWLNNLNAEESELLGELLPKKQVDEDAVEADQSSPNQPSGSDKIEDVLEELAGFLEDPALFMDALDMGMEVPSVEEIQAKADEQKQTAVEHKKAGNMEGAKAALLKSKQFTGHAIKLKAVLEHVERKKGSTNGSSDASAVKLEDLEAMLEADENKSQKSPKASATESVQSTGPAEKTSGQLKEEAIQLRDQKKIKEAGAVLKLYKAALQREQAAAEMRRRKELVAEIRKEINVAQQQIRIFEYYQRFCDPETQQLAWWKEYATRCDNVSKVIMAKGVSAINVARKKTTMMSARLDGAEEEDFNTLVTELISDGTNSDPSDERLEITFVDLDKVQENTNLQKLLKKQKRENLPTYPSTIRLEAHVHLPPNEHDTEESIELVYEAASADPLKKLELTTQKEEESDSFQSTCVFEKSQFVDLVRGNSPYGKIIRRRIERNKKITISAYHVPVVAKKGWLWSKKNKEELPPPLLLGKIVLEMQGLMTKKCIAAGEYPLMNGSGTKELGGSLKLAVRTGVPFSTPGDADKSSDDADVVDPICAKLEHYTAMVFSMNKEPPATAAEI